MKKIVLIVAITFVYLSAFAQADSMKISQSSALNNTMSTMGNIDTLNGRWITMRDGKMMVMKNGKIKMMKKDITMKNGTRMMMDGTMMKEDSTTIMQNGDYVTMDGKMLLRKEMNPSY